MIVDDVIGDLENTRHQEYEYKKENKNVITQLELEFYQKKRLEILLEYLYLETQLKK